MQRPPLRRGGHALRSLLDNSSDVHQASTRLPFPVTSSPRQSAESRIESGPDGLERAGEDTCPSLLMKGSAVRIRASALGLFTGVSSALQRSAAGSGYETGTSSNRFTISEGVSLLQRFVPLCRYFGSRVCTRRFHRSAQACPDGDARARASLRRVLTGYCLGEVVGL
jgi:hypothetical protein